MHRKIIYGQIFVLNIVFYHYTVLPGYMVSKDNSMCIKIDTVVADSSGVTAGDAVALNAICTLLSVQEGSAAGML